MHERAKVRSYCLPTPLDAAKRYLGAALFNKEPPCILGD